MIPAIKMTLKRSPTGTVKNLQMNIIAYTDQYHDEKVLFTAVNFIDADNIKQCAGFLLPLSRL